MYNNEIDDDEYKQVYIEPKNNEDAIELLTDITAIINGMSNFVTETRYNVKKIEDISFDEGVLDLFKDNKEALLVLSYIEINQGYLAVMEFKEKFINNAIKELRKLFSDREYVFDYYEVDDFIGIIVKLQLNNASYTNIALLDVFNKNITLLENEEQQNAYSEIDSINEKLNELKEQESELFLAKKNPLYLADGNPMKLIKISAQKNKYKEQINNEIKMINVDRTDCYSRIANSKSLLEEMNVFILQLESYQSYLVRKLYSLYNFNTTNYEEEMFDDNQEFISENKESNIEITYFE